MNSLMTFMVGIKYCGALHLLFYITNTLLQILGGSAAFKNPVVFYKTLTIPMSKGFKYNKFKNCKDTNKRRQVQSTIIFVDNHQHKTLKVQSTETLMLKNKLTITVLA